MIHIIDQREISSCHASTSCRSASHLISPASVSRRGWSLACVLPSSPWVDRLPCWKRSAWWRKNGGDAGGPSRRGDGGCDREQQGGRRPKGDRAISPSRKEKSSQAHTQAVSALRGRTASRTVMLFAVMR